jgi:guanylate kinase
MSNERSTLAPGVAPAAGAARGRLFILSGPSGSGKSTVIRRALEPEDLPVRLAVSVTTRPPRPGEIDGQHYHFWSQSRFAEAVAAGRFIEWAEVYGHRYGTLRDEVDPYLERGQSVLLEIDVQGGLQILQSRPDAVTVFISASEAGAYEARLRARRTDSEEALARRLAARQEEQRLGATRYRYHITNDQLDAAVRELRGLLQSFTGGQHVG